MIHNILESNMFSPYIWDIIHFYVWKLKINEVNASMPYDDKQLCIRYQYPRREYLYDLRDEKLLDDVKFTR